MSTLDEDESFHQGKLQAAEAAASAAAASMTTPAPAETPLSSETSANHNGNGASANRNPSSSVAYSDGHSTHDSRLLNGNGLQANGNGSHNGQHDATEQVSYSAYSTNGNGHASTRQHVDQNEQQTVNTYASMEDISTNTTTIPSSLPSNWSQGHPALPEFETSRSGSAYVDYGGNGRTGALISSNSTSLYPAPVRHSQGLGLHIKAPSSLLMSMGLDGAAPDTSLSSDRGVSLSPRALPEDNASSR